MYASPKPKGFVDEVSDSRLFTRGWVFQERLLSARYLHFGREQWFWQCRQKTHAESDEYEDDMFQPLSLEGGRGADLGMIYASKKSKAAFSEWWSEAVEIYSQLDFTRMTDRKIAIDGLMNEIRRISGRQHSGHLDRVDTLANDVVLDVRRRHGTVILARTRAARYTVVVMAGFGRTRPLRDAGRSLDRSAELFGYCISRRDRSSPGI